MAKTTVTSTTGGVTVQSERLGPRIENAINAATTPQSGDTFVTQRDLETRLKAYVTAVGGEA